MLLRDISTKDFRAVKRKRLKSCSFSVLRPKFAVLDETDSGLDIDALKLVSDGINSVKSSEIGILLITHYQRIFAICKAAVCARACKGESRCFRRTGACKQARGAGLQLDSGR